MKTITLMIAISVIWVCSIAVLHAAHVSCGDSITSDTVLDSNLIDCPSDGIVIDDDNVILDCNSRSSSGSGSDGGIVISGNGVTIENCEIFDFRFGIRTDGTNNHHIISNISHNNNNTGFRFSDSNSLTFTGNTSHSNRNHGFRLSNVDDSTFTGNTSHNNGSNGFRISNGSNGNTFTGNTINDNSNRGFLLISSSSNQILLNTISQNNGA